jgi:endonuclease/exonuclease/phosphatase family metal-dependent hydrolase
VPITKFLFWNLNRKPLADLVSRIVHAHRIDVVVLAECDIRAADLLLSLNGAGAAEFEYCTSVNTAFSVLVRFSPRFMVPRFDRERVSVRHLTLPTRLPVLFVIVHLPSKLYWNHESQTAESQELSRLIVAEEESVRHQRTVVVGDFNMNPFESGMVTAAGLNCVPTRWLAKKRVRRFRAENIRCSIIQCGAISEILNERRRVHIITAGRNI